MDEDDEVERLFQEIRSSAVRPRAPRSRVWLWPLVIVAIVGLVAFPAFAVPVLAVTFPAFCVWLTVRIINQRKKPGMAFWVTVGLVALVLYPLSVGPMAWLAVHSRSHSFRTLIAIIYAPLEWLAGMSDVVKTVINWWVGLWYDGYGDE